MNGDWIVVSSKTVAHSLGLIPSLDVRSYKRFVSVVYKEKAPEFNHEYMFGGTNNYSSMMAAFKEHWQSRTRTV